jgi:lipoprotein-anchoring transpeptidase ErfK/SrfK
MVFRTVGAIAALLIGVAWQDGQARAQYYSPQSSAQPMVGQQYGLRPLMPIEAEPNVTGRLGSNPRSHMVALQPNPRPGAGPAKELPPRFRRTLVNYQTKEPSGTIIIDTANTYLYLVLGNGKALRYGIGVGREGFTWAGVEKVSRMTTWPEWRPPKEMIDRQPYLPRFMAGGPGNPLGARALYLGKTVYRIHGTNQPSTIGTFVSSGCIRLTNRDIMDLYTRVHVGTRTVVLAGWAPATTAASLAGPAGGVRPPADVPRTRFGRVGGRPK